MSTMTQLAGLNDSAMDELKQTDGITLPGDVAMSDGKPIVVDTDSGMTNPAGAIVVDNFSDYDIILETHDKLEAERVRLSDVAEVVMATESISYSDIQSLLAVAEPGQGEVKNSSEDGDTVVFSGIAARLDERVPLKSFTDSKTAANLEETKKFFKKEININREAIHSLYSDFFLNRADVFMKRAALLCEAIAGEIEEQVKYAALCRELQSTAVASKNYLAYLVIEEGKAERCSDSRCLYDIRHSPLADYQSTNIVEYGYKVVPSLFSTLREFYRNEGGAAVVKATRASAGDISNNSPYYRTILDALRGERDEEYIPTPTYMELLSYFTSESSVAKLTEMKLYAEKSLASVAGMAEACRNRTPYVENGKEVNFCDASLMIVKLIRDLSKAAVYLTQVEQLRVITFPVFATIDAVLKSE